MWQGHRNEFKNKTTEMQCVLGVILWDGGLDTGKTPTTNWEPSGSGLIKRYSR